MTAPFTSNDFQAHLHSTFRLKASIDTELVLAEIEERSHGKLEQFSLIFAGPRSSQLLQGTYGLDHPVMGEVTLFLTPLAPSAERSFYEAAFTRFKVASAPTPEA